MASLFTVSADLLAVLVAGFVAAAVGYGLWVWKRPTLAQKEERP